VTGPPGAHAAWRHADFKVAGGYFAYFAAVGALMPFIALYVRGLGFTGLQVGVLTALPSVGLALFAPLWGAAADSLGMHRWLLRGALALAIVAALATAQATAFVSMLLLFGLLAFVSVPVAPLLDSYGVTASEHTPRSYGGIRVWGSLGYMASVLTVGWLMGDEASPVLLVAHALCLALALMALFRLPDLAERRRAPLFTGLRAVLAHRPVALLLLVAFLLSIGAAIISIYLGVRIQEIGGSARQVGLLFAVASASELPVIALGAWLLGRLGAPRLIAVATGVYAFRFVAFSVITVPAWLLPIQALHGLSYAAFTLASITLIHRLVERRHAATAQSLLTAVSLGLGSITGSLLGGALLDVIGTTGLFRGAAVLMGVTLAVLVVGTRTVNLDDAEVGAAV
jgi:MFS transporter, PPP family, 3-phenylpropionic acid transporter